MKNRTRMLALVGGLALVAAAMVPAHAICPTARTMSSNFQYIYTPGQCDGGYPCTGPSATSVSENLKGVYWVVGAGDPAFGPGNDSGSFAARQNNAYGYPLAGFITNYPGYSAYINGTWAQSQDIDGCPDFVGGPGTPGLCTAMLLTDSVNGSSYFMLQVSQSDGAGNFAFSGGNLSSVDRPGGGMGVPGGPVIASSTRLGGGTGVELTINPPALDGISGDTSCADVLQGFRVWAQVLPRDSNDAATVTLDCSGDSDVYVATSAVFDSGFETAFVSANSGRVECGPNAADVQPIRPRVRPGQEIELKRGKKGGRR